MLAHVSTAPLLCVQGGFLDASSSGDALFTASGSQFKKGPCNPGTNKISLPEYGALQKVAPRRGQY
jgi:hypothetical protein